MATVSTTSTTELEDKLATLAVQFRQAQSDSRQREAIAFQYGRVFDQLVETVGNFVEPDFDSLLPDGYMPKQYEARKHQALLEAHEMKSYKRMLQPFQWVFRVVTRKPARDKWIREH